MANRWRDYYEPTLLLDDDGRKRLIIHDTDIFSKLVPSFPHAAADMTNPRKFDYGNWTRESRLGVGEEYVRMCGCSSEDLSSFDALVIHSTGYAGLQGISKPEEFYFELLDVPFTELEACNVLLSSKDMERFAAMPTLETVNLESTPVLTSALAPLKGHARLKTLILNGTSVTDKTFLALVKECPNLMRVELEETKISRMLQLEVEKIVSERQASFLERNVNEEA